MTFVITQKCVDTCDTGCVDVCPVACIDGPIDLKQLKSLQPAARGKASGGLQLYINPEDCIFCGACVPECPADAIYAEEDVPEEYQADIAANELFFQRLGGAR